MSEWQYWQTSIPLPFTPPPWSSKRPRQFEPEQLDDTVNAHFAMMADNGWELVTATTTILSSGSGGQTSHHHYIWRRSR